MHVTSWCAAVAAWLYAAKPANDTRLPKSAVRSASAYDVGASGTMLILHMLQAALHQGASIPGALEAVGTVAKGACGGGLARVGELLNAGASWHDAWKVALAGVKEPGSKELSDPGRPYAGTSHTELALRLVCDALESSWMHGDAPAARIEAAVEQLSRDERARIERGTAKLAIRLLMPTGLCFLPAFVCIGVIPSIISFMV
ncbi:type II secretion system F family protein [Bifidobacterium olomucense]|nr:type II secretion system F family protein [Bifidobacterium sp. DSM 109959]